jgi:serine/threonine protein kinase
MSVHDTLIQGQNGAYTISHRNWKEGGMGIIHRGYDALGRQVIIKQAKPDSTNPRRERLHIEKLSVEAAILSRLRHPQIMRLIDLIYEHSELKYLVAEYISGNQLHELYENRGVSTALAVKYGVQLLDALAYMHNSNVIHRDIRPKNIMIDQCGDCKLIDFGTAKYYYTQSPRDTMIIAPCAAPEVTAGYPCFQSDIYSTSATLFFLLTGQLPSRDPPTDAAVIQSTRARRIHAEMLSSVVAKGMDKNPNRRYQTAEEMKRALLGQQPAVKGAHLILGSRSYPIQGELILGRDEHNDIQLAGPYISRRHAKVFSHNDRYWIQDLGSHNGTFVMYLDDEYTPQYTKLQPYYAYSLEHNDVIVLCYIPKQGNYVEVKFQSR